MIRRVILFVTFAFLGLPMMARAAALPSPCPRYQAGSKLIEPKDIFSSHGLLRVTLAYQSRVDKYGNALYCFTAEDGSQSPTLHVRPGDELVIRMKNDLPPSNPMMSMAGMSHETGVVHDSGALPDLMLEHGKHANCTSAPMTATSVNMHFHGTNTSPTCHQDEVIRTIVNSGESYEYDIHFPLDEPPGLYWYHPHIHGISEAALQGGASGAIVVEGIQNYIPEVAGLPQRLLIVRDNLVPGSSDPDSDHDNEPAWDISLNYIPVAYPKYQPAVIPMRPNQKQFWRLVNASADTILDIEAVYDGVTQPLHIAALDGVPVDSQDGVEMGHPIKRDHILVPPAGRVEFILKAPPASVKSAQLITKNVDTGPDGDNDPDRPIADIKVAPNSAQPSLTVPEQDSRMVAQNRFSELHEAVPAIHRKLYFSEVISDPSNPDSPTNFFITVDGQKPVLFDPANPPAIVTHRGAVEDWTIENRAGENHEFHIHQIHFLVLAKNGLPVDGEYLDTINVPYWSGTGPYPSVKLRMDFRGQVVGDFVYHCHILGHEDSGMMAILRVLPKE